MIDEIKPVYRCKVFEDADWIYLEKFPKERESFLIIEALYPAAAYESLKEENEALHKNHDLLQAKVDCLYDQIELEKSKTRGEEETVKRVVTYSEALQKENAELKEAIKKQSNAVNAFYAARSSEDKNRDGEIIRLRSLDADNKGLKECNAILTDENAAQAKRIEQQDEIIKATLEVIEATADFARDFYKQADKKSETRVAVPTFKELERRLRTYLPTSKNGE